jgi:hypothetical protein
MDYENDIPMQTKIIVLCFPLFVAIGYILFKIIQKITRAQLKKKYTVEVTAKCVGSQDTYVQFIDVDENPENYKNLDGSKYIGTRMSKAIFEFDLNSQHYKVSINSSTNQPYAIGDKAQILINPNNPTEGYILTDQEPKNYYAKAKKTQDRITNTIGIVAVVLFYFLIAYYICFSPLYAAKR